MAVASFLNGQLWTLASRTVVCATGAVDDKVLLEMSTFYITVLVAAVMGAESILIVNGTIGITTLSWVAHDDDDSLITFNATCSTHDGSAIAWCGFGLSPTGGMWPSEGWILQAAADGTAWIEDRNLIAYSSPDCYEVQLSSLIDVSVSPSGDSIAASCKFKRA